METSGVATVATDSIPASFLEDPVVFLSDIVNKPPSLQALDQLGGWMATWFANKAPDKESSVAPAAAAYLQAAAVHLQEFAFPTGNAHLEAATTKKQYEVVTVRWMTATKGISMSTGSLLKQTFGALIFFCQLSSLVVDCRNLCQSLQRPPWRHYQIGDFTFFGRPFFEQPDTSCQSTLTGRCGISAVRHAG